MVAYTLFQTIGHILRGDPFYYGEPQACWHVKKPILKTHSLKYQMGEWGKQRQVCFKQLVQKEVTPVCDPGRFPHAGLDHEQWSAFSDESNGELHGEYVPLSLLALSPTPTTQTPSPRPDVAIWQTTTSLACVDQAEILPKEENKQAN